MLAEHVADRHGRCRSCVNTCAGTAQPWPCALRLIADLAEKLHAARRGHGGSRPDRRGHTQHGALS